MTADQTLSVTDATPNKRRWLSSHTFAVILIILGLGVSGYLSYVKLTDVPMTCIANGPFSCDVVQNSAYSRLFNIPIAWLGFGVYVLLALMFTFKNRVGFMQDYGTALIFGLTLFAWIYSMWLVYVQFVILQALCQWCLMHETIITILFGVVTYQLYRSLKPE